MPDRELPARPNLEQYKKQAKDLAKNGALGIPDALSRIQKQYPRPHRLPQADSSAPRLSLSDAQFVIAREHGFDSWPKFARYIETIRLIESVGSLNDPVSAFIELACVSRHSSHASGAVDHAAVILERYPHVATSNIFTAAILADEAAVRAFLASDPQSATAKGGPHDWDALTHLCFSRYLRIDHSRSESFVRTARALLEAGASANTGWTETIDHPNPRPTWESAIYGAAGIARHPELTRVLLEHGADPNDEETPYHVPEGYDNTLMKILLESGRLNRAALACMLARKSDWHDYEGLRLLLQHGADPNEQPTFGGNALHHALRRDNELSVIELLLDHGANPALKIAPDGRSSLALAASRGRRDVLLLFERRGIALDLHGVDALIAACAKNDREAIDLLVAAQPALLEELQAQGGTLLAEFAGNANVDGLRWLLDLGVSVSALYEGDVYFDIAKQSTALHVAAWRARHAAVKELLARGAPINALDAKQRTALSLAVKACVNSYWKDWRSPESVDALLKAGAVVSGIQIPSGYDDIDELLRGALHER